MLGRGGQVIASVRRVTQPGAARSVEVGHQLLAGEQAGVVRVGHHQVGPVEPEGIEEALSYSGVSGVAGADESGHVVAGLAGSEGKVKLQRIILSRLPTPEGNPPTPLPKTRGSRRCAASWTR